MTNEERDIINQFIARIGGAPAASGFASGSVPATQAPPLPPVDRDADALISAQFQAFPEARYRMTQLAFVQEQALVQAQGRIQQLENAVRQAQQAAQAAQAQAQQKPSGGFFGGLFGGGRQAAPPPNQGPWGGQQQPQQPQYAQQPPPQYAQGGYQPGMFQRGGSGFLGSALTTAAGVAGGMVVGSMLTNMFTGHHENSGFGGGSQGFGDQGAWNTGGTMPAAPSQDYVDNGSWDQPQQPQQDSGWTDNNSGWSDNSGGGGDDTF